MESDEFRIVLDTNVLLGAFIASSSAAAKILRAAERRAVVPLLSKPVMDEYRAVLADPTLTARFPSLNAITVEITLRRLRFVGRYIRRPGIHFDYSRDPLDQKFIELAIALNATHIISNDQDLLALPAGRTDASRRFHQRIPGVQVISPTDFVTRNATIR